MNTPENWLKFFQVLVVDQGPVFVVIARTPEFATDVDNDSDLVEEPMWHEEVAGIIYPINTNVAGFRLSESAYDRYTVNEQLTTEQMLQAYDFLKTIPETKLKITFISFPENFRPNADEKVVSNIDFKTKTVVGPQYQLGELSADEVEEIRAGLAK